MTSLPAVCSSTASIPFGDPEQSTAIENSSSGRALNASSSGLSTRSAPSARTTARPVRSSAAPGVASPGAITA